MFDTVKYRQSTSAYWVCGGFENNQAKQVIAHADAGIGYLVLDRGGSRHNPVVTVAFIWANNQPLPAHLERVIDHQKIEKYNKQLAERQGHKV